MTPTQKDLIDTDGENRAVRAFLLGREVGCKDYEQMRRHMTNSGFNNCWPSEFAGLGGHMSKGDQQMWLRHLFALERLGALAEQPAEQVPVRTEFNRVINHAIEQGFEASTFLRCWREGDWSSCKEFGFDPNTEAYTAPQPTKREPLTREHVRASGGIVHSDGNVFFTSLEHLNSAVESANGITGETK